MLQCTARNNILAALFLFILFVYQAVPSHQQLKQLNIQNYSLPAFCEAARETHMQGRILILGQITTYTDDYFFLLIAHVCNFLSNFSIMHFATFYT